MELWVLNPLSPPPRASTRRLNNMIDNQNLLDQFTNIISSKILVTLEDLKIFKDGGIKIEDFLNYLHKEKDYFFHGSGTLIPLNEKLSSKNGKLYATDDGGVAIIKALFANNIPGMTNLGYSLNKNEDQKVVISGNPEGKFIREVGYVYILKDVKGFSNEGTQGTVEFIRILPNNEGQDYLCILEVEK